MGYDLPEKSPTKIGTELWSYPKVLGMDSTPAVGQAHDADRAKQAGGMSPRLLLKNGCDLQPDEVLGRDFPATIKERVAVENRTQMGHVLRTGSRVVA
jgi:hypothetical protein